MPLYDSKTIVVIDDNIYDRMEFLKSVLCKREFGISLEKVKFIKLSDLSARIPTDRIDDFKMYFYVFEKINNPEEYKLAIEKVALTPNIEVALLFCQDSGSFEVCDCATTSVCKVHCIGVVDEFNLEKDIQLTPAEWQSRNCLRLLTLLLYLLSTEEGAFSDYTVKMSINYPSVYCAAQYPIMKLRDEVRVIEGGINEEKKLIEKLEEEKPYKYKLNFAESKISESISKAAISSGDSEDILKSLSALYNDCENEIEKNITRDINATRYAMAETDQFAETGREPEFFKTRSNNVEHIPTVDDLLRNVEKTEGETLNVKQAIMLARGLVKTKKPSIKPFFIGAGIALLLFIISIVSIYIADIGKNGTSAIDMKLLAVCLCVPLAIVLISCLIGFIGNLLEYKKIKSILLTIRNAINGIIDGFKSLIANVREYLNDFITVFCNYHSKDYRILQCRKKIKLYEKEKDAIISTVSDISQFADVVATLFSYEQSLLENESADNDENEYYKKDNSGVDYSMNAFEYEDFAVGSLIDEEPEVDQAEAKPQLRKCESLVECIKAVKENCSTEVRGSQGIQFSDVQSPWISVIDFANNMNGGVL